MAFVFDTTSRNTGAQRGATVRLLKELGRPEFFFGCRPHISELIVKACWHSLFEIDLSPECKFFSDNKKERDSLYTSSEAEFLTSNGKV